jgi:two-component system, cell cycle response regulator DivK
MANELVLIVEDSEPSRRLARDLLRVHGYRTVEAENAEEGIVLAGKEAPDLVVMDIQLPGLNGMQALLKLRAAMGNRLIPVVACTASVMSQDRQAIMAAGFDAFVSKPIDLDAFVLAIRAALARRRPAGGA